MKIAYHKRYRPATYNLPQDNDVFKQGKEHKNDTRAHPNIQS